MKKTLAILVTLTIGLSQAGQVASADSSWEDFNCTVLNQISASSQVTDQSNYDVIIYGGTPAGVAAARSAASMGKTVLLLSESGLFGGAISNGVSATDLGSLDANVGLAKTYLEDLNRFYHSTDYRTEPKVAECIFLNWLTDEHITLGTNINLESAHVQSGLIKDLTFHTSSAPGTEVQVFGKDFVDASYAGDLMFEAGAPTRLGMADYYSYQENTTNSRSYNLMFTLKDQSAIDQGAIDFAKLPQVTVLNDLNSYKTAIRSGMPSFTYRLCVTKNPDNKIAFTKTDDYETYAPAWRTFMQNYVGFNAQKTAKVKSNGTVLTQLWRMAKLPNNKWDLNAYYSSFTNLTMKKDYFDHPENRAAILASYTSYLQSFLYFVQNDPSVPDMEKNALKGFGLCADEFTATNGWPQQPYLREGRRLIGKTTMTAKDILSDRRKKDAVAAASYAMDSKPTLFVYANGSFARDRSVMYRAPIYEIPLSAMLPKTGPKNLIVAVGISASPSAYASIRMEPQYIELGQAAGIAASLGATGNSVISNQLISGIKAELTRQKGFNSIQGICFRLNPSLRKYWGFDSWRCNTTPFGLIISQ